MRNRKRQISQVIELPNQERIRTLGEEETYKYLDILEVDTIKQVEVKKNEIKKYLRWARKLLETKLYDRHQWDKHLGCPSYKINGFIVKKSDEGRTQRNRLENKNTNDDA